MPGKFRKSPIQSVPHRNQKSIGKAHGKANPIVRKPSVTERVPSKIFRRAVNVSRTQNRIVKRQAVRKQVNKTQPRPRPIARPNSPPTKRMSKNPAPPPAALKPTAKWTSLRPKVNSHSKSFRQGSAMADVVSVGTFVGLTASSAHPDIRIYVSN